MAVSIDQNLFDDVISQALDLLRLSAQERYSVIAKLNDMATELTTELVSGNITSLNKAEVEDFLSKLDDLIGSHYSGIETSLDLKELASVVSDQTANHLEVQLGSDVKTPSQDYLDSIESEALIQGAPISDWWGAQSADFSLKFKGAVRTGLSNNETNQQIIARIVGKAGVPGVLDVAKTNAATLVQTSVQSVANNARRKTFQSNSKLIKGIKQVSTLDSHTSLICVAYSGAEWDLNYEPINGNDLPFNGGTPRHFNCRSVEVPVTKTFRELGIDADEAPTSTRASVDGQISADTTMAGFLKRKGVDFQNTVLGDGRAALFQAGKITLRDLVSGNGSPLSLQALRAKVAKRG